MLFRLRSSFLFPLTAMSVVAMSLYLAWRLFLGPWNGPRLHLNLFLAWVPYVAALAAVELHRRRPDAAWSFRALIVVWFFFFPNAPYLVTDWRYLPGWTDELWYATLTMTTFSLCGLSLAAVSLYLVQTTIAVRSSRLAGRIVAVAAIGLSGLGVYLGRFIRLNTWDLLVDPLQVVRDIVGLLRAHQHHLGPVGFTVLFTFLLASIYYLFVEVRQAAPSPEERRLGVFARSDVEEQRS
jgi:uncharacterized membrane protein